MKKRLVLSLLSILLVSLLFSPHTFSQQTPETVVRVAPRPLSDNDSHLKVDIVIENGQAVTGYQVMLQYDSDYIKYVDIDHGNYLPDDLPDDLFFGDAQIRDTDPNDPLKAILFAATAFPNQSEGDGVLATLTFEKIIDESSDLTLLDVTRLSHDVVDNTVAVSSPQLKNSKTHVVILHSRTAPLKGLVCDFLNNYQDVGPFAYSPDGTVLAVGSNEKEVYFLDASTGEPLQTSHLEAKSNVYSIAFSPKGRWLAIGTGGNLYLWDRGSRPSNTWREWLETNALKLPAPTIEVPHSSSFSSNNDINSITFSRDETRLAIGTGRDDIFVSEYDSGTGTWEDWNDNTLLIPKSHASQVRSVAFHPREPDILASGYKDGRVRIWDLSNYKNNGPDQEVLITGTNRVYSIAFSPNGDYLATAGIFIKRKTDPDGQLGIRLVQHRIVLWERGYNNKWENPTYLVTEGRHDTDVLSVAFHPSRDVLLSGDKNGNIHAWGVPLGNHLGRVNHSYFSNISSPYISSIAFNSQGNAVAVGTDSGEVYQFTFDDQFTFNVSNQALTQTDITINDCPKVHVIWYHASNEIKRGPEAPTDRQVGANYISPNNVRENLKEVQVFFKEELGTTQQKLGPTFKFALDNKKDIKVEYIQSDNFFVHDGSLALYSECDHFKDNEGSSDGFFNKVWSDITTNHGQFVSSYNTSNDIYLVLVQSNHGYLGATTNTGGVRGAAKIGGRIAMVALGPFEEPWSNEMIKLVIAHELGHNFGLFHDFREKGSIMSYNFERAGGLWFDPFEPLTNDRLISNRLSKRSKNWLKVHPAFNKCTSPPAADNPIEIKVRDTSQTAQIPTPLVSGPPGTIDPMHSITVSPNSGKYKIHLKLKDLDGLHHVELIAPSLKSYKGCPNGCGGDDYSVAKWRYSSKPRTRASIDFDVTELMAEYPKGFDIIIATIDKGGNTLYFDLQIVPGASGNAPLAQKHLPKETALLVNYPNPFNPETWIPYQLANPADVSLTIYNIQGGVVRDLDLGHQRAGTYHSRARAAFWDGRNAVGESVASGVYFYTLKAGDFAATRKMLIRK